MHTQILELQSGIKNQRMTVQVFVCVCLCKSDCVYVREIVKANRQSRKWAGRLLVERKRGNEYLVREEIGRAHV